MHNRVIRWARLCALAALFSAAVAAQPVRRDVLESAEAVRKDDLIILTIHFALPVNYLGHFPATSGKLLLLQLRPIVFEAPNAVGGVDHREALRVPPEAAPLLEDIVYHGEDAPARYLMLYFSRKVTFEVMPGRDLRSVVIAFGEVEADSNGAAGPKAPPEQR